ncbi:MAG: DNA-3-methyladenine glycosylase 2 family protein [Actinobacteria bacterium]|nr:MAG: DNA-3-methyladenine glycosylase 2 family protein [Actinomycetota bacterium]
MLDPDRCYEAIRSRDARLDGRFFTAVTTTGVYCRPSCPARTPRRENVRFFATAAAAQAAGFRACLRCRPDAAPGSPEWDLRADLSGRALRLIADGVVDREGVAGLARRLGYSERHLHRQLTAELGAGPLALARAQRGQTARALIETTDLPLTDVAFAAGFASVRQFNDTVRAVFGRTPTDLRRARRRAAPTAPGTIALRLAYRAPFAAAELLAFLGARAVPGVEEVRDGAYRRTLRLPHGEGIAELRPRRGHVACSLRLADLRDVPSAVRRCRALLDLDADPVAVDEHLARDPLLRPLVAAVPGRRVPGAVDGAELAFRAVLGQQVSVVGACTLAGRLVREHGTPLALPDATLTHLFPTPAALAAVEPARLPLPAARGRALVGLARALADGEPALEPGADRAATTAALARLPGIGPWTGAYVAMRALGDPDAFLPTDLGVRRGLDRLGAAGDLARAERWRPWRAYAVQHLWAVREPVRALAA